MPLPPTVRWADHRLYLLDQTLLPHEVVEVEQHDVAQLVDSIQRLVVRGAPAIGVAGAYGVALAVRDGGDLHEQAALLAGARPTAVNLGWAVQRVVRRGERAVTAGEGLLAALEDEAAAVHREDQAQCEAIGRHGAPLVADGAGVLTHCNAGALATTGIGTALAPLYAAHEQGTPFQVFADETRPLLQGARLTAWELDRAGIDVEVVVDGAAAHLMARGEVGLVVVGADRVAANGDTANKIGTLGVALAAQRFVVPFYVACPSSTIDLATPDGGAITIEERAAAEVTGAAAPAGVGARNPAFDVTPHDLVTGFITDRGILRAPYGVSLAAG
jgi:methylthioribose-1-phosphate isomerase